MFSKEQRTWMSTSKFFRVWAVAFFVLGIYLSTAIGGK